MNHCGDTHMLARTKMLGGFLHSQDLRKAKGRFLRRPPTLRICFCAMFRALVERKAKFDKGRPVVVAKDEAAMTTMLVQNLVGSQKATAFFRAGMWQDFLGYTIDIYSICILTYDLQINIKMINNIQ